MRQMTAIVRLPVEWCIIIMGLIQFQKRQQKFIIGCVLKFQTKSNDQLNREPKQANIWSFNPMDDYFQEKHVFGLLSR